MIEPSSPFEVRVLCCRATPTPEQRSVLHSFITEDEEQQRRRFHRAIDADRFLVGRGTLRGELGRMLGIAPRNVPLELGKHGKVHVIGGTAHVNVSHSGDVVLLGFTSGAPIGVDVEAIEERFADDTMLDTCFSDREILELTKLPAEARVAAFFHTWTSREAIMKWVGLGFHLPRDAFDVSVDPRVPPMLVATRTPVLTRPVTLVSLAVPAQHVAMLAIGAEASAFRISVSNPMYGET